MDDGLRLRSVTGERLTTSGRRRVALDMGANGRADISLNIPFVVADVATNIVAVADLTDRGCAVVLDDRPRITQGSNVIDLMRQGNKFLLPMRFPRGVWGELVADVAGETVAGKPLPKRPSDEKVAEHVRTHIPSEPWCRCCVLGRARDEAHRRQHERETACTPTVAMDYGFLSLAEPDAEAATVLAMVDTRTGMMAGTLVREKAPTRSVWRPC